VSFADPGSPAVNTAAVENYAKAVRCFRRLCVLALQKMWGYLLDHLNNCDAGLLTNGMSASPLLGC
jgi:hypothetical protein